MKIQVVQKAADSKVKTMSTCPYVVDVPPETKKS